MVVGASPLLVAVFVGFHEPDDILIKVGINSAADDNVSTVGCTSD
ncbi:hypothetical protein ACFQJ8_26190 [Halocatena marina]